MAQWNKVKYDFDPDEETVNFGARAVVENDGSIYESRTMATIKSDSGAQEDPNISSSLQYGMLCVIIDRSLTVFSNGSCEKVVLSMVFDTLITTCQVSNEKTMLYVALENGRLYCLHLIIPGKLVFSINTGIEGKCIKIIKICLQQIDDEFVNVMLVTNNGAIHSIPMFNVGQAHYGVIHSNDAALKYALDNIYCSKVFEGFPNNNIAYAINEPVLGRWSITMVSPNAIFIWHDERSHTISVLPYSCKKVQFFKNYSAFLCLSFDGSLSVICPKTFCRKLIHDGSVYDFATVQDSKNSDLQIVILTEPDGSSRILKFVSYPNFTKIYQFRVSKTTYLAELMDSIEGNVVFLEATHNEAGETEAIQVKSIIEGIPECRLNRLIRKEKFAEAEVFAEKFHLSLQPIYRQQATVFLEQLGPWAKPTTGVLDLDSFIGTLEKIEDVQFVVDSCNQALVADYSQMYKLLQYARKRVLIGCQTIPSKKKEFTKFLCVIDNTVRKLNTFEMVRKMKCRAGTAHASTVSETHEEIVKEWIEFSRANILNVYKTNLSMGEVERASLIWARHLGEISENISIQTLHDIFASLPEDAHPVTLWPWLQNFIPSLLYMYPDMMSAIAQWAYKTTISYEKLDPTNWPQNGIEFADGLVNLLQCEGNRTSAYFHEQYMAHDSAFRKLLFLLKTLSELRQLKIEHGIRMTLDAYMSDPLEVSVILLNKVRVDKIPQFVKKFLDKFIRSYNLHNDSVFSLFVQTAIRNSKGWWCWAVAPWEKQVAAAIGFIENLETRLQRTLEVLKKAPVPWSTTIINLAETGSSMDHPISSKIRAEKGLIAVKLILKKYGYESIGVNENLIRYIIKQHREDMMQDLLELTKSNKQMKLEAFNFYINYYLSKGNTEDVIQFLNRLDEDTAFYCCEGIVNYVIASLNLKMQHQKSMEYYIEMLGYVRHKLQEMSTRSTVHSHHCEHVINSLCTAKSLYILNKNFDIAIGFTEYHIRKRQVLEGYIKTLYNDLQKDDISMITCYRKAIRVADLLGLEKMNAMSLLLEQMKCSDLLKTFKNCDQIHLNITTEECKYVHEICNTILQNSDVDEEVLNLLRNMCASALRTCCDAQIAETLSLTSWIDLYLQCLSNNIVPERNSWKLYSTYRDTCISPKPVLLPALKDALQICMSVKKSPVARSEDIEENEIFNPSEPTDLIAEDNAANIMCKKLLVKVEHLQNEHTILSVTRLLNSLYVSCCTSSVLNRDTIMEIKTVYHRVAKLLLRKLTTVRSLDLPLALSTLFTLPDSEARNWLATTFQALQGDFPRHSKLTHFGYEYCRLANHSSLVEPYMINKLLHYWAERLLILSIPYKDVFVADNEGKMQIVERIIRSNNENTMNLIRQFCGSFGLDADECLMIYLRILLTNWDPSLNIIQNGGKKELRINEDEVAELRRKCNMIVEKVHDKVTLTRFINGLWKEINFYHYEVYLIIMDLVNNMNTDTRSAFYFLQNYTRTSKPGQFERDEWMHLSADKTELPAISEWRLPYLLANEQWKIITPELNLRTYETWLHVASILKLQNHVICTLAIKEEVNKIWENIRTTECISQWYIYPRSTTLLENIMRCLSRITGPDSAYYATAALYFVVTHTPPGADQVAAAQACYKYALQAAKQLRQYEEGLLEKIKCKYLKFASEHILHIYDLASEIYFNKLSNPENLVRELYMDNSIIERYRRVTSYKPNINAAVNELCTLFCLNSMKLRLELLDEWLRPSINASQMNSSFTDTIPFNNDNLDYSLINDDNLLRACYLLESGDVKRSANFLINIGFGDDVKYGPGVKCRALHVLQSITDTVTIQELTKRDLPTLRRHMKTLDYLNDLSYLGYEYTPEMFTKCSKLELAKILTETQYYTPRALAFVSQICLDYEIYDETLWNNMLLKMAKLRMIKELKKLVLKLQSIHTLVTCEGYIAAWQTVITEPFRKLELNPTAEQLDDCIKSINLVHACPVTSEICFDDVIEYCFQCKQTHFAATFLLFLNYDCKQKLLLRLGTTLQVPQIIASLQELTTKGVPGISHCIAIVQEICK